LFWINCKANALQRLEQSIYSYRLARKAIIEIIRSFINLPVG
jgi:hypothetical protein